MFIWSTTLVFKGFPGHAVRNSGEMAEGKSWCLAVAVETNGFKYRVNARLIHKKS